MRFQREALKSNSIFFIIAGKSIKSTLPGNDILLILTLSGS